MFENQYSCINNDYRNNMESKVFECRGNEEYRRSVFPENPMLAQSYVPYQYMNKTFRPDVGLRMGTIFPELVSPYKPGQDMKEMEYLEGRKTMREENE